MTSSLSGLSPSFNAFLFATVCNGPGEMPVSVISALARLDLDPWTEAAELASMPTAGAPQRLSSLLAGVADGPAAQPDRESLAARLVGLLPSPAGPDVKPGVLGGDVLASPFFQSLGIMWLFLLASMAVSAWVGASPPAAGAHGSAAKPIPTATAGR
jgi:hypothetical protein